MLFQQNAYADGCDDIWALQSNGTETIVINLETSEILKVTESTLILNCNGEDILYSNILNFNNTAVKVKCPYPTAQGSDNHANEIKIECQ